MVWSTPSRRSFLLTAAGSLGASLVQLKEPAFSQLLATSAVVPEAQGPKRLFPQALPASAWSQFESAGYTKPVTGIIYRTRAVTYFSAYVEKPLPASGMPLGGIDTGGLYLDPSGVFGYSSIFNHLTPIGGPLNTPYLGVGIGGKTWVLTTGQTKNYAGNNRPSFGPNLKLLNADMAESSDYWGHFPIADIEYQNSAPVQIGLRAWSPFIPGDVKISNTPGAIFEVHLRNPSTSPQTGTLGFSFPGFSHHHTHDEVIGWPDLAAKPVLPKPQIERHPAPAGLSGISVEDKAWGMSYVLATVDEEKVRVGAALGTDGLHWADLEKKLPEPARTDDGGSSLGIAFTVQPGQEKVIRLVLAWYAPEWEGNGVPGSGGNRIITQAPGNVLVPSTTGKRFTHMYASRFANAGEVATFLARNHQQLLQRIIAWQSVIYEDSSLPGWLSDALVNAFYYFPPCSMWAQAKDPIGTWCEPEEGVFALEEAPRSCPHVTTLSNFAMAGPLLSFFFPELAVSSLKAYRATQKENGDIAQLLGRWADVANAMAYDYQEVIVGSCYAMPAYLHWKVTGDNKFLREFYPSVKKALQFSFTQRPDLGPSQIIAMPPLRPGTWNDSEWFEDRSMIGYVSHPGGLRMAAARMLKEWAHEVADTQTEAWLDTLLTAGSEALQKYLWKDDHYLIYNDTVTGKQLDAFFTPQLNGQFFARFNGVPPVFPKENVAAIMQVLREQVCPLSKLGMPPTYSKPGGGLWDTDSTGYLTGQYIYNNHQVIWNAFTFMYEGHKEFGLELLRKNLEISYCKWGYLWDGTNCLSAGGDTGEVNYGWDYWFNWSIWIAPAALLNQEVSVLAKPGGLVHRMIEAGRTKASA
ncbi:MAG: GH116 family glycosyl-hydrolase [Terriglobia bacterium]